MNARRKRRRNLERWQSIDFSRLVSKWREWTFRLSMVREETYVGPISIGIAKYQVDAERMAGNGRVVIRAKHECVRIMIRKLFATIARCEREAKRIADGQPT